MHYYFSYHVKHTKQVQQEMQYIIILVLVTTREYYFVILDGVWECAHVGKHCAHVGHAVVATSIAVKIAHPFIRHTCIYF